MLRSLRSRILSIMDIVSRMGSNYILSTTDCRWEKFLRPWPNLLPMPLDTILYLIPFINLSCSSPTSQVVFNSVSEGTKAYLPSILKPKEEPVSLSLSASDDKF